MQKQEDLETGYSPGAADRDRVGCDPKFKEEYWQWFRNPDDARYYNAWFGDPFKTEIPANEPIESIGDVLGTSEIAKEISRGQAYVRLMMKPKVAGQGNGIEGKFIPIPLGELRQAPSEGVTAAPAAYAITRRMLDLYKGGCKDFPIDYSPAEELQILTLDKVSALLNIGPSALLGAITRGDIPAKRFRIWVVLIWDVLEFLLAPPQHLSRTRAKFTDEQVVKMRQWSRDGKSLGEITRAAQEEFDITVVESSIYRLLQGHTYGHIGGSRQK